MQFILNSYFASFFTEYMNSYRLQQDHPCVINYIRRHYLKSPSPRHVPLNLDYPKVLDQSEFEQPITILELLKNKVSSRHSSASLIKYIVLLINFKVSLLF